MIDAKNASLDHRGEHLMAVDLIHTYSTNELHKEVQKRICEDERSLPIKSKTFAAVAKLQRFDVLPEVASHIEIENYITKNSFIEINRGMAGAKGVPAPFYARELISGAMYPGTLSAFGNGIYFATPSQQFGLPAFPRVSVVAHKYTKGEGSGIIVRAALRTNARVIDIEEVRQFFREFRNRAKAAGITDVGAFAAAFGYDALYCDGAYDDSNERVYIVLNRGALVVQKLGLQITPE